jgi:hypothetical protein
MAPSPPAQAFASAVESNPSPNATSSCTNHRSTGSPLSACSPRTPNARHPFRGADYSPRSADPCTDPFHYSPTNRSPSTQPFLHSTPTSPTHNTGAYSPTSPAHNSPSTRTRSASPPTTPRRTAQLQPSTAMILWAGISVAGIGTMMALM